MLQSVVGEPLGEHVDFVAALGEGLGKLVGPVLQASPVRIKAL